MGNLSKIVAGLSAIVLASGPVQSFGKTVTLGHDADISAKVNQLEKKPVESLELIKAKIRPMGNIWIVADIWSYFNKGNKAIDDENYRLGALFFEMGLKLHKELRDVNEPKIEANAYFAIGSAYYNTAEQTKDSKEYQLAIEKLEKGLTFYRNLTTTNPEIISMWINTHKMLANAFDRKSNSKNFLVHSFYALVLKAKYFELKGGDPDLHILGRHLRELSRENYRKFVEDVNSYNGKDADLVHKLLRPYLEPLVPR